jgi:hypothetical protein
MASNATDEKTVTFSGELTSIDDTVLVRLPADASRALPSRGQVAVIATVDGHAVETVVEPDGRRGHWVRVDERLRSTAGLEVGDTAQVVLQDAPQWPEPEVPEDLAGALADAPERIRDIWHDITPMARWEWVRWVGSTRNPDTRARRVEVSIDKLDHGKRRPCCFDLSSCTDPELSRGGKLREPS